VRTAECASQVGRSAKAEEVTGEERTSILFVANHAFASM